MSKKDIHCRPQWHGWLGNQKELSKIKNIEIITKDKAHLDLTNQELVNSFFKGNSIDEVFIAAAKVGGIYANNTFPADFIYTNLQYKQT